MRLTTLSALSLAAAFLGCATTPDVVSTPDAHGESQAEWTDARLRAEVSRRLEAHEPLGAEALLEARASQQGSTSLAETRRELAETTRRAGQENCTRLTATVQAETPYWSHLLQRYCKHFGVESAAAPVLPGLYGSLAFRGNVEGVGRPHFAVLMRSLVEAFEHSPWFVQDGKEQQLATLSGSFATKVNRMSDPPSVDYRASMTVRLEQPVPVEASFENALSAQGDPSAAAPAPSAGEAPSTAVPAPGAWFAPQAEALGQRFTAELAGAWHRAFCVPTPSTLEAAAHCLYGDPKAQGLEAPFATVLGGDAPAFLQWVGQGVSP